MYDSYQQVCQSGWLKTLTLAGFLITFQKTLLKQSLTYIFLIVFLHQKRHQNPIGLLQQAVNGIMQGLTGDLCVYEQGVWTHSHCLMHQCTYQSKWFDCGDNLKVYVCSLEKQLTLNRQTHTQPVICKNYRCHWMPDQKLQTLGCGLR